MQWAVCGAGVRQCDQRARARVGRDSSRPNDQIRRYLRRHRRGVRASAGPQHPALRRRRVVRAAAQESSVPRHHQQRSHPRQTQRTVLAQVSGDDISTPPPIITTR